MAWSFVLNVNGCACFLPVIACVSPLVFFFLFVGGFGLCPVSLVRLVEVMAACLFLEPEETHLLGDWCVEKASALVMVESPFWRVILAGLEMCVASPVESNARLLFATMLLTACTVQLPAISL